MKLEIDMPEHHYNNIIAFDSVSLGRVPYKGIIMYAINAIKRGKALDQEPTTKNDLGVDCISRADARKAIIDHQYSDNFCEEHDIDHSINTGMALIALSDLSSVTPQEPFINKTCVSSKVCEHDKNEVLDKIRAEIEQITDTMGVSYNQYVSKIDVLAILDKYKAESEAEDGECK